MFDWDFDAVVAVVIIIGCVGGLAVVVIKTFADAHKQKREQHKELESPFFEPQLFEYKATVIGKYCGVEGYGSSKMPQTRSAYYLTFKTYDGRILKYNVLEQDYFKIEENQTGTLAVVNDNFYGFCPD